MRNFSWQYFVKTGDVDAYLLYKAAAEQPDIAKPFAEDMAMIEASEEQGLVNQDLYSK